MLNWLVEVEWRKSHFWLNWDPCWRMEATPHRCPAGSSYEIGSSAIKHKDDGTSVQIWINAMEHKGSSIVFYTPQEEEMNLYPELIKDDFILGIRNDAQAELLKKYGSHICIDGTRGTNSYNFELIALLVLDDMLHGFPCLFLISYRTDAAL
ncbi:hypothetical protein AVEN_124484-1 [Araneus ventricosus]|uniref:Uncharacterized protein n=1 Tax=Araneus ventricosus TaxID=182803 RepID=A0A4Y2KRR3_ARAVE|nr:hypothetical protein AVEN_124484-1 [Araneus ventricosus]